MFYLVEKLSADHWKTLMVTRDRVRADEVFARLSRENPYASFRLAACRPDEVSGSRASEILAERRAEPPAPPAASPMPAGPGVFGRWPALRVNPLRAFVYSGLALGFAVVLHDSFDQVLTRMRADAAEPEGEQTQLVVSQMPAPGRPLLGGAAQEALSTPEPVVQPVVPVVGEVPMKPEVTEEPVAEPIVVALLPAAVVSPTREPIPEPVSPVVAPVIDEPPPVHSSASAASPGDQSARVHAACRASVMERARFTARVRETTDFRTSQKGGRLRVEGKDVEFRNVFDEWITIRYTCDVDAANGAVGKVEIKPVL